MWNRVSLTPNYGSPSLPALVLSQVALGCSLYSLLQGLHLHSRLELLYNAYKINLETTGKAWL